MSGVVEWVFGGSIALLFVLGRRNTERIDELEARLRARARISDVDSTSAVSASVPCPVATIRYEAVQEPSAQVASRLAMSAHLAETLTTVSQLRTSDGAA